MEDQEKLIAQIKADCAANTFMQYNHIRLAEITAAGAVTELTVSQENINPFGFVHGGALYTMSDCACGIAARRDGQRYVTMSSSFNFLHSAQVGEVVRAESRIRRRGRSSCYVDVDVTNDQGVLLASGNFTFHRV